MTQNLVTLVDHDALTDPFLGHSTCSQAHFKESAYKQLAQQLNLPGLYHRKEWEWIFILHHIQKNVVIGPHARGLGFGVGGEPLTAALARQGAHIRATDAPPEIGIAAGWTAGDQLAGGLETIPMAEIAPDEFSRLVSFSFCDMNNIAPELTGYDFCWSSCALEHLGSLRMGINFIIESVEKTLRIGGVAVHTTEFNVYSNEDTLDNNWTVIYRLRDMQTLVAELRARGHIVDEFIVAPDSGEIDMHIDIPPYTHSPHLKLLLEGTVTTSCGIVVRRGK